MKHHSTLNKLRESTAFTKRPRRNNLRLKLPNVDVSTSTLPFCSLTHNFSHDFDAWLKTAHGSCLNTRSGRHRNVKAYLELARRDKVTFEDSYEYFVNSTVQGQWQTLSLAELARLEEHYTKLPCGSTHRRMLQKFLFSCHCGLRLADLKLMAFIYLYTDQYTNRQLQLIGNALGIETKLHHHIGRETFATNFIRRGGKVEVLQKLLGHKKLSMTMKYVHVDEAMKQAEIDRMDELDEQ